jgi:tyrosine-protein phosphatase SIW14
MRSSRRQLARAIAGVAIVAAISGVTLVAYAALRPAHLRNFGTVREGVLYRSGQLSPTGLDRVLSEHPCRTVVSLRPFRDADSNADTWEEEVCRARGVKYVRIAPPEGHGEDGLDRMAEGFLAVMDDPTNHPVLVHCLAGRDRTGTMCAIYRMEFDEWSNRNAADEMQRFEFDPKKDPAAEAYERYVLGYKARRDRPRVEKK